MAFQYNHYYEIYNYSSGKYVNLNGDHENDVVNNGEKVTMYARTNNPDQRWALAELSLKSVAFSGWRAHNVRPYGLYQLKNSFILLKSSGRR